MSARQSQEKQNGIALEQALYQTNKLALEAQKQDRKSAKKTAEVFWADQITQRRQHIKKEVEAENAYKILPE